MAGSLADLVLEPAPPGAGVPIVDRVRFVCQLAAQQADPAAAWWDAGKWDQQTWAAGTWAWVDVTCDVRAFASERGRDSPLERFRVGVAVVELANVDGRYSTIDPPPGPYVIAGRSTLGAGTVVRAGFLLDNGLGTVTWRPTFTGLAEQWVDLPDYGTADQAVNVTVVETLSELATVDRLEQPEQGNSETPAARFDRLLNDAAWRWPRRYTYADAPSLLPTTMAGNRLGECYLTADSVKRARFYTDTDGAARYDGDGWAPSSAIATIGTVEGETNPTDVRLADDTLRVVNDATIARRDGTAQRVTDSASRDRFGAFTHQRLDLLTFSDAEALAIAAELVTARAWDVRRLDGVEIHYPASRVPDTLANRRTLAAFMATVGLRSCVNVRWRAVITESLVEAVRHALRFGGDPPDWTVNLALVRRVPAGPYN